MQEPRSLLSNYINFDMFLEFLQRTSNGSYESLSSRYCTCAKIYLNTRKLLAVQYSYPYGLIIIVGLGSPTLIMNIKCFLDAYLLLLGFL